MKNLAVTFAAVVAVLGLAVLDGQAAESRPLTANDVSYYRIGGKGETFETPLVAMTTNETARRSFWMRVAAAKKPEIYQLHFRSPKGAKVKHFPSEEDGKRQVDAWFADGSDFKACPERIYAVTLGEENITWDGQLEFQNALAKHLKERYGVKTYHWLTEPLKPTLALEGDGWVFDAYSIVDPDAFCAHVESFILTGLPVVPCLWASGHFCRYHQGKDWLELTRFTLERFDICRALGLPVQVFAVAGTMGSSALWFNPSKDAGEEFYRETVRRYLNAAKAGARAGWRKPVKRWRANVARNGELKTTVSLKDFELVRETCFDDVRNWKLTKDGLTSLGAEGTLEWNLVPSGDVVEGAFVLKHGKDAKGTFGGVALSADGETRVPVGAFRERRIALVVAGPVVLESISFVGRGVFREDVVELTMDDSDGRTDYRARRIYAEDADWHLASLKGAVARRRLVQKLALPGCRGKLTVTGDVRAMKSFGGSVALALSLDGATALTNAVTVAENGRQELQARCEIPTGAREAYCIWNLEVNNGRESPGAPRVDVGDVRYRLQPMSP